jgi:hypothetical protein
MAIRFGFSKAGDFIAVDDETKTAIRGHKGSQYYRMALGDGPDAAREMIADAAKLRADMPDLPSHSPEALAHNFAEVAALLPDDALTICPCCGASVDALAVFPGGKCLKCHAARFDSQLTAARLTGREAEFWEANRPAFCPRR